MKKVTPPNNDAASILLLQKVGKIVGISGLLIINTKCKKIPKSEMIH